MALRVLQERQQIGGARNEMLQQGVSFLEPFYLSFVRRFGLIRSVCLGDEVKSWDVLSTLRFLEEHVDKGDPVLDIGCYASEILVALHHLGFSALAGVDLNPRLHKMPFQDAIQYVTGNFMHTRFENGAFRAITAISVIEHGFDAPALLRELSRLLQPGGYFIASFDYWPDKIDTSEMRLFDMDWKIFSRQEVVDFIREAESYGLVPVGELQYEGKDRVIDYARRQYTFAWLALQKKSAVA
jgi:SAM-dependent methyltransferase